MIPYIISQSIEICNDTNTSQFLYFTYSKSKPLYEFLVKVNVFTPSERNILDTQDKWIKNNKATLDLNIFPYFLCKPFSLTTQENLVEENV